MTSEIETTIADLQSRLAFQEDTLQALNQIVVDQDATIIRLQKQLQLLNKKLDDAVNHFEQQPNMAGNEPPPPHY